MTNPADALLAMQDEVANSVAALTGIRQQFIDAGWSPPTAERVVIEMMRAQGGRHESSDLSRGRK